MPCIARIITFRWGWVNASSGVILPNLTNEFTNEKIAEIFNGRLSVPEIKDALMEACDGKTRDNFSFYIITIQKVEDSMGFKQNILSFLYSFI